MRRLAERYAEHPAVVMWHVGNEYGCHLSHGLLGCRARRVPRLAASAATTTIDALNEAWGTNFWSQRYGGFDEVFPPRKAPYSHNPAQLLDFRRFTSDMLLECYLMEREIIRAAGATQPITTNFMGPFKPADYAQWARHMDVIADDCYPDPNDPESVPGCGVPARPRALAEARRAVDPHGAGDGCRQLAAREPAEGAGADGGAERAVDRPRRRRHHVLPVAAVAGGRREVPLRDAAARGHRDAHLARGHRARRAARRAAGPARRCPRRARRPRLRLGELVGRRGARPPDERLDYLAVVQRWYGALHRRHVQVDIVPPERVDGQYALAIAPLLYLLRDEGAAALTSFVEGGGHLLAGPFTDVVDENDRFRDGGFLTQLGALCGIRLEDFGALVAPDATGPGEREARFAGEAFAESVGTLLAEEIAVTATDATVEAAFTSGRRAGHPALTARRAGRGTARYLATVPDDAGALAIVDHVLADAGVEPVVAGLPEHVEAARRGELVTLVHHGVDAAPVTVPISGTDAVTGERVDAVTLGPFDWALVLEG